MAEHGYTGCPDCGLSVRRAALATGEHRCVQENVIAHQTRKARDELVGLEGELADYLATDRAQKLLAFERWCEENRR